ncbi:MAG TPA: RNA methyltransferase [Bacteroidales bacterium]|nr:RNA methyltransferase [Bacteroidales bacterium]
MRKLKNSELSRKTIAEFKAAEKSPFVVLLDNVRSLNNIGSIFRTADCLLAERIILCGITAKPPHRDIHKTALGATESVYWEYFDESIKAINQLKEEGYIVIGIEQVDKSLSLQDFTPESGKKYALVFGHEVKGVSQEVVDNCDLCIEIPQFGTKHSFNISVSAGIVMWEIFRKICYK